MNIHGIIETFIYVAGLDGPETSYRTILGLTVIAGTVPAVGSRTTSGRELGRTDYPWRMWMAERLVIRLTGVNSKAQ